MYKHGLFFLFMISCGLYGPIDDKKVSLAEEASEPFRFSPEDKDYALFLDEYQDVVEDLFLEPRRPTLSTNQRLLTIPERSSGRFSCLSRLTHSSASCDCSRNASDGSYEASIEEEESLLAEFHRVPLLTLKQESSEFIFYTAIIEEFIKFFIFNDQDRQIISFCEFLLKEKYRNPLFIIEWQGEEFYTLLRRIYGKSSYIEHMDFINFLSEILNDAMVDYYLQFSSLLKYRYVELYWSLNFGDFVYSCESAEEDIVNRNKFIQLLDSFLILFK